MKHSINYGNTLIKRSFVSVFDVLIINLVRIIIVDMHTLYTIQHLRHMFACCFCIDVSGDYKLLK